MPELADVLVWMGAGCAALVAAAPILRRRSTQHVQRALEEALRSSPPEPPDR